MGSGERIRHGKDEAVKIGNPIVVSKWAEVEADESARRALEHDWTFTLPSYLPTDGVEIVKGYLPATDGIWLPRYAGYQLARKHGKDIINRVATGSPINLLFLMDEAKGHPRFPEQQILVAKALRKSNDVMFGYGGVFQAPPGFGKTVCGVQLIAQLGKKAAILIHKEFLMKQWRKSIERFLVRVDGSKPIVGHVQGKIVDWEGADIVLIMIQSLISGREYPMGMFESFGTVVVDECHRIGAPEFNKAIVKFPAMHRLGFSATPKRKDKCEKIVFGHIGEIIAKTEAHLTAPKIKRLRYNQRLSDDEMKRLWFKSGSINRTRALKRLSTMEQRNKFIVEKMIEAAKAGRVIIFLTDFRDHVFVIEEMILKQNPNLLVGRYMGQEDENDLKFSEEEAQVILGTYQMAMEGLDIPRADTIFLATPRVDIRQPVGRILRICDGKKDPIVVDVIDEMWSETKGWARARERQYEKIISRAT